MKTSQKNWKTLNRFLKLSCPWFTLLGEHLEDDCGVVLDYWRIDRVDSVIVIPIMAEHWLLPPPSYRPGVKTLTLDFPGGRVPPGSSPAQVIPGILRKELGINMADVRNLAPVNDAPLAINSSFSNQRLHGFSVEIEGACGLRQADSLSRYPVTSEGFSSLMRDLTCLQCRAILMEWYIKRIQMSESKQILGNKSSDTGLNIF